MDTQPVNSKNRTSTRIQKVPFVVGLTGGIGAGKSMVATLFQQLEVPVVDADEIAKKVVSPGQPTLAQIAAQFGTGALQPDGSLDRAYLRKLIFQDAQARSALEAILHPRIRQLMSERITALDALYCIASIPLLVETQQADLVDRILVVDASLETQIARVQARDDVTETEALAIIRAQASREQRLSIADDVIVNDRDLSHLRKQVETLHNSYMSLAKAQRCQMR